MGDSGFSDAQLRGIRLGCFKSAMKQDGTWDLFSFDGIAKAHRERYENDSAYRSMKEFQEQLKSSFETQSANRDRICKLADEYPVGSKERNVLIEGAWAYNSLSTENLPKEKEALYLKLITLDQLRKSKFFKT